jgi:hypothetical protein
MLFQILDDKKDCLGIYAGDQFYYGDLRDSFTGTWDWSPHLKGKDYQFAKIYCNGKTLEKVCPEGLLDRYEIYRDKIKSFIKASSIAKINLDDICLFDLIPERHLFHWCQVKNEICEHVFSNYPKPPNHKFLSNLTEMVYEIAQQPVKIDDYRLFLYSKEDYKAKTLWTKFGGQKSCISYNIYGTKTGRLSTMENTFPILNLKKEISDVVIPTNDMFVQLDFNGAEIRTLLSLAGKEQPKEDIHTWNIDNVYRGFGTRSKAKQRFFAWLYNPNSQDHLTSRFYDRESVLKKYYRDGRVHTPMGRVIEADDFHALNYLLQSTSSDNCLLQAIKIFKLLKSRKSFIHSIVHDSLTIDLHKEDRHLVTEIQEMFEDTDLGRFPSSMHFGKNYRDMEKV